MPTARKAPGAELVWFRHDGTPDPRTMPQETEWWSDLNPHQLKARLKTAERRGQVARMTDPRRLQPGRRYGVLVVRLAPRPPTWRKPALITVAVIVPVTVIGVLTVLAFRAAYEARGAIGTAAVMVLLGWIVVRLLAGHRPTCVGLHCPGCSGH
jgi:hypothetical protein